MTVPPAAFQPPTHDAPRLVGVDLSQGDIALAITRCHTLQAAVTLGDVPDAYVTLTINGQVCFFTGVVMDDWYLVQEQGQPNVPPRVFYLLPGSKLDQKDHHAGVPSMVCEIEFENMTSGGSRRTYCYILSQLIELIIN